MRVHVNIITSKLGPSLKTPRYESRTFLSENMATSVTYMSICAWEHFTLVMSLWLKISLLLISHQLAWQSFHNLRPVTAYLAWHACTCQLARSPSLRRENEQERGALIIACFGGHVQRGHNFQQQPRSITGNWDNKLGLTWCLSATSNQRISSRLAVKRRLLEN